MNMEKVYYIFCYYNCYTYTKFLYYVMFEKVGKKIQKTKHGESAPREPFMMIVVTPSVVIRVESKLLECVM